MVYLKWRVPLELPDEVEFPDRPETGLSPKIYPIRLKNSVP